MKRIALIFPVHNKLDYTKRCVELLNRLISESNPKNSQIHIVIIDDGSTDGTEDWLRQNHPEVTLLKGDGNLWWSGGVNVGARYVIEENKADYILLWNNDIAPDEDYFKELDKLIPNLDADTIAGSKIYCKEPADLIFSFGGIFNPRTGRKYLIGHEAKENGRFNEPAPADWLPGMGTLVPVEVIKKIGYWDEKDFPQYHGDSDFTYRAKLKGYHLIVYPSLKIWNDNKNTGLENKDKFKDVLALLKDIRSQHNLKKNILFYKRFSSSPLAYWPLVISYFYLFGGFFKWKILSMFGMKRK